MINEKYETISPDSTSEVQPAMEPVRVYVDDLVRETLRTRRRLREQNEAQLTQPAAQPSPRSRR